jgi:ABC-type uncharacterized transport system auxiliary subunit
VKYWEIIADNLSKAGWSWGCVSAVDSEQNPSALKTMKTKVTKSNVATIFVAAAAALFVAGCAEMQATNTTSLLTAAGFRARTPRTPKQQEIYAALPAYKVERATVKGKKLYVFKDEKAGVAYVGNEPEYERYKQLCVQEKIPQNFYMSENMDRVQSHRWFGQWGAEVVWR